MGLTRAEKHNRMLNKTFDHYKEHQASKPCGHLYGRLLEIAEEKLEITQEKAKELYGLYTVGQWEKLLSLGWNK